ncbi:hypothetical protein IFR05_015366 [Cadophora sp. M221]|nr:hypothetical protein IFR05_015366 [Cadophora sp. M221]
MAPLTDECRRTAARPSMLSKICTSISKSHRLFTVAITAPAAACFQCLVARPTNAPNKFPDGLGQGLSPVYSLSSQTLCKIRIAGVLVVAAKLKAIVWF